MQIIAKLGPSIPSRAGCWHTSCYSVRRTKWTSPSQTLHHPREVWFKVDPSLPINRVAPNSCHVNGPPQAAHKATTQLEIFIYKHSLAKLRQRLLKQADSFRMGMRNSERQQLLRLEVLNSLVNHCDVKSIRSDYDRLTLAGRRALSLR